MRDPSRAIFCEVPRLIAGERLHLGRVRLPLPLCWALLTLLCCPLVASMQHTPRSTPNSTRGGKHGCQRCMLTLMRRAFHCRWGLWNKLMHSAPQQANHILQRLAYTPSVKRNRAGHVLGEALLWKRPPFPFRPQMCMLCLPLAPAALRFAREPRAKRANVQAAPCHLAQQWPSPFRRSVGCNYQENRFV